MNEDHQNVEPNPSGYAQQEEENRKARLQADLEMDRVTEAGLGHEFAPYVKPSSEKGRFQKVEDALK